MQFAGLFLGGPAVLETGLNLCAANGIKLPFNELEIKRLRWTVPLVSFLLCVDSLNDQSLGRALRKMCDIDFDAWLRSRTMTVRIGDYVVAPQELKELRKSGKIRVGMFADIRDVRLELTYLTAHVLPFRINGMKPILDGYRELRLLQGRQDLAFERIDVLAHAVCCLVFGREPNDGSLQKVFVIDVLAEAQKQIDAICNQYSAS